MAELHIRLRVDPLTGKKNLVIGYESDSDALPMEHEDEHRRLVERVIERGLVSADELGEVIVEREETAKVETPQGEDEAAEDRESVEQGQ